MWMPEYQNKDIIGGIITTSIDVIGRRTSEGYAIVMISNIINELKQKYDLLKYVNIKRTNYISSSDNVIINPDIKPLFGRVPNRPMEQVRVANIKETYNTIGWKPITPLRKGLELTVDWYREQLHKISQTDPLTK